ncbi:cysteine peptidase family C39 domain-containing protein [Chitinophaga horti]|uniref:Cysteine peptidase family C39 domain-containing protein n=1 Tax=Chitinophaga horti TaxID=2920382 RepID=A0ABY6JAY9_9BACT|nr:vitamin K epoxide reductase family protein [Chitinophaga horti]UYQ95737.1 cysteine peptidase family C39 domain-containing protein [Chitinophaga horti]
MQHCEDATAYLLSSIQVPYTRTYLRDELLQHPEYPNLQAVADVIGASYNVACLPYKIPWSMIALEPEIKPPFMARINTSQVGPAFATVTNFSANEVALYNPGSKKKETLSAEAFEKIYTGTVLLVGKEDNAGEKNFAGNQHKEKQKQTLNRALIFVLPILTLLACLITAFLQPVTASVFPIIFTLVTLMGCVVGAMLLWHEIDQHNPALKQVCQAGVKVNCAAILNSKAAKIFGQSWSSIGFSYFMGTLMALFVSGVANTSVLQLVAWMNVLALPYTVYSVYFQYKVAKQWCVLCLAVQGLLVLQFVAALAGGFHLALPLGEIPGNSYLLLLSCLVFTALAVMTAMPAFEKAKESRQRKIELQRLKQNPQMFEALLSKQKRLEHPSNGLGITLGKADAPFRILKVCNPYCGPCAQAHPMMEELLEHNKEVQLQIIFTATGDDTDMKTPPVKHLLAIAAKDNEQLTRNALDEWYLSDKKDYVAFAQKFPLNGELQQQTEKVKEMWDWSNLASIAFTPTFYISMPVADESERAYFQLPDMYTVNDLKYFLID